MKKLLALIALVAMVAVSSIAYAAAPADVTTTAGVTNAAELDASLCVAGLSVSFDAATPANDFTTVQQNDCPVIITAGQPWNLTGEGATAAGNMLCTVGCNVGVDNIAANATGTVEGGLDGGDWGYYFLNTMVAPTVVPEVCNASAGSVCPATTTPDDLVTDADQGVPVYLEEFSLNIDVAVDNDNVATPGIQPAGTYADQLTLTMS